MKKMRILSLLALALCCGRAECMYLTVTVAETVSSKRGMVLDKIITVASKTQDEQSSNVDKNSASDVIEKFNILKKNVTDALPGILQKKEELNNAFKESYWPNIAGDETFAKSVIDAIKSYCGEDFSELVQSFRSNPTNAHAYMLILFAIGQQTYPQNHAGNIELANQMPDICGFMKHIFGNNPSSLTLHPQYILEAVRFCKYSDTTLQVGLSIAAAPMGVWCNFVAFEDDSCRLGPIAWSIKAFKKDSGDCKKTENEKEIRHCGVSNYAPVYLAGEVLFGLDGCPVITTNMSGHYQLSWNNNNYHEHLLNTGLISENATLLPINCANGLTSYGYYDINKLSFDCSVYDGGYYCDGLFDFLYASLLKVTKNQDPDLGEYNILIADYRSPYGKMHFFLKENRLVLLFMNCSEIFCVPIPDKSYMYLGCASYYDREHESMELTYRMCDKEEFGLTLRPSNSDLIITRTPKQL